MALGVYIPGVAVLCTAVTLLHVLPHVCRCVFDATTSLDMWRRIKKRCGLRTLKFAQKKKTPGGFTHHHLEEENFPTNGICFHTDYERTYTCGRAGHCAGVKQILKYQDRGVRLDHRQYHAEKEDRAVYHSSQPFCVAVYRVERSVRFRRSL